MTPKSQRRGGPSPSASPWLAEAGRKVADVARLEENWDTYGARKPTAIALANAQGILQATDRTFPGRASEQLAPYFIGPLPDGGITVEWRAGVTELGVDIGPDGVLSYLSIEQTPTGIAHEEHDGVTWGQIAPILSRLLALHC